MNDEDKVSVEWYIEVLDKIYDAAHNGRRAKHRMKAIVKIFEEYHYKPEPEPETPLPWFPSFRQSGACTCAMCKGGLNFLTYNAYEQITPYQYPSPYPSGETYESVKREMMRILEIKPNAIESKPET